MADGTYQELKDGVERSEEIQNKAPDFLSQIPEGREHPIYKQVRVKIDQAKSPGPDQPSAEVPITHKMVLIKSARFFLACRSHHAPIAGMSNMLMR